MASFGMGRIWQNLRAGWDTVAAYNRTIEAIHAEFVAAVRTDSPIPRANPAAPHTINLYPILAQRLGEEGDVGLKVLVLANGQVGDVRIVQSSGHIQLDAAAVIGVGYWYYLPAVQNHQPIDSWVNVMIRFRMQGQAA